MILSWNPFAAAPPAQDFSTAVNWIPQISALAAAQSTGL